MSQQDFQRLLSFFKVLANESRLKIVGILANRACSVSDLADLLGLREPTVSHHLSKLKELDLVRMRAEGNVHLYSLNQDTLFRMKKDILSAQNIAALVDDVDERSWEQKVLNTFVIDDRLAQIPAKHKQRRVILQWLAEKFKPGTRYPEREVNEIIKGHHPDTAALRRYLVDRGLMRRERGVYWRPPVEKPAENEGILETFVIGERLTQIPAKHSERQVVLQWLADKFTPGVRYSEREVNETLRQHYSDTAALRRHLINGWFMQRESGVYWRSELDKQGWKNEVLETFVVGGRLQQVPTKHRKRLIVLEWLAEKLTPDTRYTESQLDTILSLYHPDTEVLRRDLIGWKFLRQEGGVYWRVPKEEQMDSLDPYAYTSVIEILSP